MITIGIYGIRDIKYECHKMLDMEIEGMAETARCIAHDYEHGLRGSRTKGFVGIVGLGCIVGSEYK